MMGPGDFNDEQEWVRISALAPQAAHRELTRKRVEAEGAGDQRRSAFWNQVSKEWANTLQQQTNARMGMRR